MITSLQALIQGIVEGVTEFLPISSTGHLIVSSHLLGVPDNDVSKAFDVVIQFGAIVAVIWYYRAELAEQIRLTVTEPRVRRFWLNLFIAFFPVAVMGLAFHKKIKAVLMSPTVVAISLIVGGVILIWSDRREEREEAHLVSIYDLMPRHALAIGFAQVFSLIPGVSRSGSSMVGGMLTGLDRETATRFSFFLAIPTLGSATLYEFWKERAVIVTSSNALPFAIGTVVSFIVALLSIGWLLRVVSSRSFVGFGLYRIVAGLAILGLIHFGGLMATPPTLEGPAAAPSRIASPREAAPSLSPASEQPATAAPRREERPQDVSK